MDRITTKAKTQKPARARLMDIAHVAGVSRNVVGHVLNGGGGNCRVSQETARLILEVAKQMNYHPNHAARLLCGKRSHTYGLLVASAGDPLRSFIVQYLDAEGVKIGCRTFIGNTFGNFLDDPHRFQKHVEEFGCRGVDGVFCAVHNWCGGDRRALLDSHPNTVFYDDPSIPGASFVTVDRCEGVRLAVRHLVERGRKRIALAVMTLSRPAHLERLQGYREELQASGFPVREELIFNGEPFGMAFARCNEEKCIWEFPAEIIHRSVDALVTEGRADAIVASDDFWAAEILRCLHSKGIRVPEDVAVVGYLNHYLADWTYPALTTIDLRHEYAAREMVRMLEKMITQGSLSPEERVLKIKPRLIVRRST